MTSPAENTESNLIPETPTVTEATWLAFTIAFAVFALIAVVLAFVYVFDLLPADMAKNSAADKASRAAAVTPFLAACAAAVTFCAVMWRGAINSRQADEQRRQNDSADEAELALLLDKAVAVLKSQEQADIQLALAMLNTIALAPNGRYATFALDLAIDTIVRTFPAPGRANDRAFLQITTVLSSARSQLERIGTRGTALDFSGLELSSYSAEKYLLPLIEVLPPCEIRGITSRLGPDILEIIEERDGEITFYKCEFFGAHGGISRKESVRLKVDDIFIDCKFSNFIVREVRDIWLPAYEFIKCDFSGAMFDDALSLEAGKFEDCYYDFDDPPYVLMFEDGREHRRSVEAVRKSRDRFDLQPRILNEHDKSSFDDEIPF